MKKHLIELMIEAGVKWPDGTEYAAQDKCNNKVYFFDKKPDAIRDLAHCCSTGQTVKSMQLTSLCHEWDKTIVTREQYEEALADVTPEVQQEEKPKPKYCASVMRQMPDNTIEQLTADYHAKATEADRLQAVADEALKAANEVLTTLQKAGELIGLLISVGDFQKYTEQHQQPIITDWRDLQVGDVIKCVSLGREWIEELDWVIGEECEVIRTEDPGKSGQPIEARFKNGEEWWIGEFRFIRRPNRK